jgi:hypothetical protein
MIARPHVRRNSGEVAARQSVDSFAKMVKRRLPARGCQSESPFVRLASQNHLFLGSDDGSGGAGIRTLACSKNRWADFEGQGGTAGVAGSRLLATGDCG